MLSAAPIRAYIPVSDVSRARKANAGTSKASQAFWEVDDVEAEVAALRARGVTFEDYDTPGMKTVNGIYAGGGARTAWFKDTEGTIMAVSQAA